MSADDLSVLLESSSWIRRRVDRVEFLDLMTVRRTIVLTLDLGELAALLPPCGESVIPLGWFVPWANAGAVLLDADQHVVPYLTSQESDSRVQPQIEERLREVRLPGDDVNAIRLHRKDGGVPGSECTSCADQGCAPGEVELMKDKWGCRATLTVLKKLRCQDSKEARELARILLAWQTNFVLFARVDAFRPTGSWATLQLSFDEELREWEPPWERRTRVLERIAPVAGRKPWRRKRVLKHDALSRPESCKYRRHISRGGPFQRDLDKLFPRRLHGALASGKRLWLRRAGRRGMLGLAWHVAWLQASGMDAASHQVDVILPSELMAVRMRMLRARENKRRANVADQVGPRATIVAPDVDGEGGSEGRAPAPTLLSLVITQRNPASWYGGAGIALLTGVAILATALLWMPLTDSESTGAITILIVAPTLVATLLSVRAASDIAEQLTKTLRRLIGAVGVLAAVCAVGLVAQGEAHPGRQRIAPSDIKWLWIASAVVLLLIAAALLVGACRIRCLIAFGRALRPREVKKPCPGTVLSPEGAPRIPPPDGWLAAGEGELVPWGWLDTSSCELSTSPSSSNGCFWPAAPDAQLIKWVRDDVTGFGDTAPCTPLLRWRIETVPEVYNLVGECMAVVEHMQAFAARDVAEVEARRLADSLRAVESSCNALQASILRADVRRLWRLASEVARERELSQDRIDEIKVEYDNVARSACGYRSRLRRG